MVWKTGLLHHEQLLVWEQLLEEIISGKTLRAICARPEMPSITAIMHRVEEDEEFKSAFENAKRLRADVWFDDIIEIADRPLAGVTTKSKSDGNSEVNTGDNVARSRMQIESRRFHISKVSPKKYGDFSKLELSGVDGEPIKTESTIRIPEYDASDPESVRRAHEAVFGAPEAVGKLQTSENS